MTSGFAATVPAGAAGPVVASGTVVCRGVQGSVKFAPALTPGGTRPVTATTTVALRDCVPLGSTNLASTAITGTARLVARGPANDCAAWTGATSLSGSVTWKGNLPRVAVAPTAVAGAGTAALGGTSGPTGFTLTDPAATGSFAGASAGELTATTTGVPCTGSTPLASVPVTGGQLRFGPAPSAPVVTSAGEAHFTEGAPGEFTVAASSANPLRFVHRGELPSGVHFVSNPDNATATLAGTPDLGTAGGYPLEVLAVSGNGQVSSQTLNLVVAPIDPALAVVESVDPASGPPGTEVTITGTGFTGATAVTLAGEPAEFTVVDDNTITAVLAGGGTGDTGDTGDTGGIGGGLTLAPGPNPPEVTTGAGPSAVVSGVVFLVTSPPSIPRLVDVIAESVALYVTWAPNDSREEVTRYTVKTVVAAGYTGPIPPGCGTVADTVVAGSESAAMVVNVCAGVPYTATIVAKNAIGNSAPSVVSFPAVPLAPAAPPQPLINAVRARPNALVVQWAPPQPTGNRIADYTVTARAGRDEVSVTVPSDAVEATVPGLRNNVAYDIEVRARSEGGTSEPATDTGRPSTRAKALPPSGLLVVPDGAGSLIVDWIAPVDPGSAPVTQYVVRMAPSTAGATGTPTDPPRRAPTTLTETVAASTTALTFDKLDPATYYDVSVTPLTAVGAGATLVASSPVSPAIDLADNAALVPQSAAAAIASVADGRLRFASPPPAAFAAAVSGDVLVIPGSPAAPEGLIVTVQSTTTDASGQFVVDTVPAAFGDAFDDFSFSVSGMPPPPAPPVIPAGAPRGGARLQARAAGISTSSFASENGDPTINLVVDQEGFSLRGSLSFTPSVSISAAFTCTNKVLGVCVGGNASASSSASIAASQSITAQFSGSRNVQLVSMQFGCICFSVGPVPVAIYPQLNISLNSSGTIKVSTNGGLNAGGAISWSSQSGFSTTSYGGTFNNSGSPAIVATANGVSNLVVIPSACLYNVLCGNFTGTGTLTANANTATSPYFVLCASVTFTAGLTFNLLWWNQSQTTLVYSQNFTPCYTVGPIPPITLSVSPAAPTVPIGAGVQQFSAVTNAPPSPLTWSLVGGQLNDSISPSGMLSVSAPGNRNLTVRVVDGAGRIATTTVRVGTTFAFGPPQNLGYVLNNPILATVSWQPPVNTGGFPIVGYTVLVQGRKRALPGFFGVPQTFSYAVNSPATSLTLEIWPMRTWYSVTVFAWNQALRTSPAATVTFTG